jgi:hypothetical protein
MEPGSFRSPIPVSTGAHSSAADRVERRRHGRTWALPCGQSAALNSADRGRRLREARHGEQPQSSLIRASIRRSVLIVSPSPRQQARHINNIRCIDGPGRPVVRGFIRWCRQQGPGVGRGAGPWRGSGSSGRRPADPFAGPGLPEADGCDVMPRVAEVFGPLQNSMRQARGSRRCARAAFLSRCPARSPPRALPAGCGSTWCPGSAGLISGAWIRGAPRRRSRAPTGRHQPRWYASSTPRCA